MPACHSEQVRTGKTEFFRHGRSALVQLTADLCLGKDTFWPYVLGWLEKVLNCRLVLAVKISLCGCNGQNVMRLKILSTATKTYFGFALQQKCEAFFMTEKEEIRPQIRAELFSEVSLSCSLEKRSLLCVHALRQSLWHGEEPVGWPMSDLMSWTMTAAGERGVCSQFPW